MLEKWLFQSTCCTHGQHYFSSTSRWCCYAILARSRYLELIHFPLKILRNNIPPHPPDGPLLAVLTLVLIFSFHLFALIYGIWSVFRTRIRTLWISSRISYSRRKVFRVDGGVGSNSGTIAHCDYIHARPSIYGILRELKSRIFVSVPLKDCVFRKIATTKESFLIGHIFTSVAYTSDDIKDYDSITSYDSDAIQCVLYNSANAHIWSILADFVPGTLRRFLPSADCIFRKNANTKASFLVGHIFTSVAYTSDDMKDYDSITSYDSDAI